MQFSLRTMLLLMILIAPSIGVIRTLDFGRIYYTNSWIGYDWADVVSIRISAMIGGLSAFNRVAFVKAILSETFIGLIVGPVAVLLSRINSSWSRSLGLSLIFAIPAHALIAIGRVSHPMTLGIVVGYLKLSVVPSAVCMILLIAFLFLLRFYPPSADEELVVPWNRSQWIFRLAIAVIYLLASAYGWHNIRQFHTDWRNRVKAREKQLQIWNEQSKDDHAVQI